MAKYGVTLPIAGQAYVEVEAESAKEAIKIEELNSYDRLCEGNVMCVSGSEVSVRKLVD